MSEDFSSLADGSGVMQTTAAGQTRLSGTVSDIQDEELLRRAVTNARDLYLVGRNPRWSHVMHSFALGSTYAAQLCRRFGLDPDEQVGRNR